MTDILTSRSFAIASTLVIYWVAQKIYARWAFPFLNPVLITILALMGMIKGLQIPYERYAAGGQYISFWLGPAVVALGVPLYQHLGTIKRQSVAISLSLLAGSVAGIVSAAGLAGLLGASDIIMISIAPKSATTPIAMGIVEKLGGIPSLTAAIVVVTGVLGAVMGPTVLRWFGIASPTAFGLAMGGAAHGLGTSRALEEGEIQGAMGGLALCVNGIMTAVFTPVLLKVLLAFMNR
jgi:predicted murein hydrolase (TIGR00659 family)